ncbi:hypothetical protein K438DRAFT_1761815 [Mycena galopus ATCC 62051]|nr:hypothetical protein K438DRAFT_1761815 [Mycena galopus ATCC 62051]
MSDIPDIKGSARKTHLKNIKETREDKAVTGHEAARSEPKVHDERRVQVKYLVSTGCMKAAVRIFWHNCGGAQEVTALKSEHKPCDMPCCRHNKNQFALFGNRPDQTPDSYCVREHLPTCCIYVPSALHLTLQVSGAIQNQGISYLTCMFPKHLIGIRKTPNCYEVYETQRETTIERYHPSPSFIDLIAIWVFLMTTQQFAECKVPNGTVRITRGAVFRLTRLQTSMTTFASEYWYPGVFWGVNQAPLIQILANAAGILGGNWSIPTGSWLFHLAPKPVGV